MKILFATSNQGKLREVEQIISPLGIQILSLNSLSKEFVMPEETGSTFEENAEIKAVCAYKSSGLASLADDSGLEVDALKGMPGIYSARYAGENASDVDRINKLLKELEGIPDSQRTARFVCVVCCVLPSGEKLFARGECEGHISKSFFGEKGFGYDPVFVTSSGKTFAELSCQEKNSISHRGKALNQLYLKLKEKIKEFK